MRTIAIKKGSIYMKTLKWVVATLLTMTAFSNAFAQADVGNENLKSFVVKKRIELQNDQMNLVKLQDKLKNLELQGIAAKAMQLPKYAGAISLGGFGLGSLIISPIGYLAVEAGLNTKYFYGGLKIAGVLLATGAVMYLGNEAYLILNKSQIAAIGSKMEVIQKSISEREASLNAIEAKL